MGLMIREKILELDLFTRIGDKRAGTYTRGLEPAEDGKFSLQAKQNVTDRGPGQYWHHRM